MGCRPGSRLGNLLGALYSELKMRRFTLLLLVAGLVACQKSKEITDWPTYAGSKAGNRYSSNTQITPANVSELQVAWTYVSGDKDSTNRSQNQCNPIMVEGILYGTTPRLKLFALNAATGEVKWIFDPVSIDTVSKNDRYAFYKVNRGVVYWEDDNGSDKRVFFNTGSKTWAINAATGRHVESFGKGGYIELTENLERDPGTFNPFVAATTPGIIYKDLLIMGHRVAESADAAPGHIRAFDVHTGEVKWIFHTIPQPGEVGHDSWEDPDAWKKFGGANNWAGMSLDEVRGIVYVPTGSIGGDFYGGIRPGANLFGNSLIALDAATGKRIWHYQVVHHDLWDRDLPANPNLVTLTHNGKKVEAVAQITKHGYIFIFDRQTGEPLFPIEERPVPASDLPGEVAYPTQPIPTLPEPFARQSFSEEDISDLDSATHAALVAKFKTIQFGEPFTPPSKKGVWIFPGFDGGGEWGGAAVDPETGILYVNSSELPWSLTIIDIPGKRNAASLKGRGEAVYGTYCVACHGPDRKGIGSSFPGVLNMKAKYNAQQLWSIIEKGKNMMPAFAQIKGPDKEALLAFLLELEEKEPASKEPTSTVSNTKSILDLVPYTMTGYNRFLDANGYPGIKPPWGTLNAVNLNTGELLWKVPLGEYEELTKRGIPPTGTENYGGPLVTKSGLIFIAATKDEKIRAFDKDTGEVLWQANLPAAGYATPATYIVDGRQFVVIACGGGKIGSKSGDSYVAFALPSAK